MRAAFWKVMDAAEERNPDADVEGVLIQEMVDGDAVEMMAGCCETAISRWRGVLGAF